MKRISRFLIVMFIFAACSSPRSDISGEWKLISYGDAANPTPAMSNVNTSIQFDANGQIHGNVGCNSFGGNYKLRGDKLAFNSIVSTMMYCEETSIQEQGVLSVFTDNLDFQVQLNGGKLTITSLAGASAVTLVRK
jgi:heat shock protein HslJ